MITKASDIIEEMLGDIEYDYKEADLYPFMVRVGCVKMAAARHERFEYLLHFGEVDVDNVFSGDTLRSELLFVFPERFMSVHEQQHFMHTMKQHPDAESIEKVDLITSSPLVIGGFMRQMIRILTWPDDDIHNGEPQWAK